MMPRTMVATKPIGSRPGTSSRATYPATIPTSAMMMRKPSMWWNLLSCAQQGAPRRVRPYPDPIFGPAKGPLTQREVVGAQAVDRLAQYARDDRDARARVFAVA